MRTSRCALEGRPLRYTDLPIGRKQFAATTLALSDICLLTSYKLLSRLEMSPGTLRYIFVWPARISSLKLGLMNCSAAASSCS
jgi:hypothetical protein